MPGYPRPVATRHRILFSACALALSLAAPAGSHPGHGYTVVNIGDFKYDTPTVNAVQNDYVFWNWAGPDTNHTVTADDGSFDSDSGKSGSQVAHKTGDGYSFQFTKPGTYTYHCKIHSFMTAKVVVAALPKPPPATKPRLTKVSAAAAGRQLRVRFTVNQAVSIRAIVRKASGRTVREFDFPGPPGSNRRTLKLKRFKAGRYSVSLIAIDSSTGLATRPVKRGFSLH